jgi:hypothetical protein
MTPENALGRSRRDEADSAAKTPTFEPVAHSALISEFSAVVRELELAWIDHPASREITESNF